MNRYLSPMMLSLYFGALVILPIKAEPLPDPLPCASCFIGNLSLTENLSDQTGRTKILLDDFYFVDPDKFVWKAGKGDVTDGATIPPLFQPIVGGPFEKEYLPAAVIHDHYSDKNHRVRPWQDTARVFYQAMIVNGVNVIKAKAMYFAIYAFGPHWGFLAQGVPCGTNCKFSVPFEISSNARGEILSTNIPTTIPPGFQYAEEPANYSLLHSSELSMILAKIHDREVAGEPLGLRDIELLAKLNHNDNAFLRASK